MLTLTKMQAFISANGLMDARKNLVRYGKIISDESSEHAGNHYRYTVFLFSGCEFNVSMKNGEVLSILQKNQNTIVSLVNQLKIDLLSCSTELERSMCKTISGQGIVSLAHSIAESRPLSASEYNTAYEFGYRRK